MRSAPPNPWKPFVSAVPTNTSSRGVPSTRQRRVSCRSPLPSAPIEYRARSAGQPRSLTYDEPASVGRPGREKPILHLPADSGSQNAPVSIGLHDDDPPARILDVHERIASRRELRQAHGARRLDQDRRRPRLRIVDLEHADDGDEARLAEEEDPPAVSRPPEDEAGSVLRDDAPIVAVRAPRSRVRRPRGTRSGRRATRRPQSRSPRVAACSSRPRPRSTAPSRSGTTASRPVTRPPPRSSASPLRPRRTAAHRRTGRGSFRRR